MKRPRLTIRRAIVLIAVLALLMMPLATGRFDCDRWGERWTLYAEWRHVLVMIWGGNHYGFQVQTRPYWWPS